MDDNHALRALIEKYQNAGTDPRSRRYAVAEGRLLENKTEPQAATTRIGIWLNGVRRLEQFVQMHQRHPHENNRRPREKAAPEERRLADWVRFQRRQATDRRLCGYQCERLELVRGFSWNPVAEHWESRFREYVAFFESQGRAPRYRAEDEAERKLAAWAAKQRHGAKRNSVPPDRRAALKRLGGRTSGP